MTDDYDHLPVSPAELRDALNDAHGGTPTDEEVEALVEEMRTPPPEKIDDEPDDDADDGLGHGRIRDVSSAKCPLCEEYVVKDEYADHIRSCGG